ncbi:MAG: hypothetical protein AABW63_01735 [Nanoarchaeota archaeon]
MSTIDDSVNGPAGTPRRKFFTFEKGVMAVFLIGLGIYLYNKYDNKNLSKNLEPDAVVINQSNYIDADSNGSKETFIDYTDSTGKTRRAVIKKTDTGIIGYDTGK